MTNRFLATLLLCFASTSVWSDDSLPVAEAPEALFEQKIGDVGVVVEADGTWTTRLAGGWGAGFTADGMLPALGYPGFEKGGVFVQKPDFTLTLRLVERYYLSVVYGGSLKDRSFLVGYQGQSDEFLQWIKAGNAAFGVPERAGQVIADGRPGAPALGAAAKVGPVRLELLGRYEDGTRETKTFRGTREATASQLGLDRWIRGRFFRIPVRGASSGLRVAVLEGNRYREVNAEEASIDPLTGEIVLATTATRSFAVTWGTAQDWSNPPTSLLGLTADALGSESGLGAGRWFLLTGPGVSTAFEIRNRYAVPEDTQGAIVLVSLATGRPVADYTVGQARGLTWFTVSGPEEAPFFAHFPGLYPGGGAPPYGQTLPWVFDLPSTIRPKTLELGPDVAASSLVVVRNGLPIDAYTFEADSGKLTLDVPVYDTDWIEVSFQRQDSDRKASDLVLWQGGRWDLAPKQALEWGLQGRWNMEKGSYTTADLQSPGRVAASLTYSGAAQQWTWKAEGTAGAILSDSTGHRRLFEAATAGPQVVWDGDSLRPSAAPRTLGGHTLTEANRAPLAFRNYWSNDPLTGTPQVSAWGKAGVEREPSGPDSWVGPYLVRGDGIRSDRLAVLESDPAPGEWMGLQAFFDAGKPRDLKGTAAISATVRAPGGPGKGRLFLQAGALSENFDGTGAVRRVEYRSLPSLAFFDQRQGDRRFFPLPENSTWGNDGDKDGSVGTDGALITRELEVTSDQWTTVRFLLTDRERQALQRTTGWRLVWIEEAGEEPRTVLVGPVVFEGSHWTVLPGSAPPSASVNPVEERSPSDKSQQSLRVNWSGRSQWAMESSVAPVRPTSYRSLRFRYRLPEASGRVELTVAFTDRLQRGVKAQWTAEPGTGWRTVQLDLSSASMTVDGRSVGQVNLRPGASTWDRLTLSLEGTASSGELFVTDWEATDPVWEPLASSLVTTQWKQPSPWPSTQWPAVSDLEWVLTSFQSGLTPDSLTWQGTTTLAGDLGPVKASGEATFVRSGQQRSSQGAYEATLPLGWAGGPRLEWTDRFSDRGLRSEQATLRLPWLGVWGVRAAVQGPPDTLEQDYAVEWKAVEGTSSEWNAGLSSLWSQSRPQVNRLGGFANVWVESWSWLKPSPITAPFYLVTALGSAEGVLGPVGFSLKAQNQASQSLGTDRLWSVWGDWEVKFPLTPGGKESWSLTPSLTRLSEGVYEGFAERTPKESAVQATRWLWSQPETLAGVPFRELLSSGLWSEEAGLRSAKAQSGVGVDWERPRVANWTDLVVPSSAGVEATALSGMEGQSTYRARSVSANLEAKGINLFGTLGSTPLVEWYRTDVWGWSLASQWGSGSREEDRLLEGSLALRSELVLTPVESVGLRLSYRGQGGAEPSQGVKASPSWNFRGPADLPVELPRWLSPKAFRRQWIQDLGAELELGWQQVRAPIVRDLQVTWKGALQLSEKSELSLTTKWGQQWQSDLTVVGLEAALDLVLTF